MWGLLKELWPFISEVFVHNKELRDDVKKPKFILKLTLVLTLFSFFAYGIYRGVTEITMTAYQRNTMLSEEVVKLQQAYSELSKDNRDLEERYNAINLELYKKNAELHQLGVLIVNLKKGKEIISVELLKCREKPPEVKYVMKTKDSESDIMSLLNELE